VPVQAGRVGLGLPPDGESPAHAGRAEERGASCSVLCSQTTSETIWEVSLGSTSAVAVLTYQPGSRDAEGKVLMGPEMGRSVTRLRSGGMARGMEQGKGQRMG
jgi:hypothetical protein